MTILILCETSTTYKSLTKYLDAYEVSYEPIEPVEPVAHGVIVNADTMIFKLIYVLNGMGPKSFDLETNTMNLN